MSATARDVMDTAPLTVAPELPVKDLAALFLERGQDGACVVANGRLAGIVTSMDLVFQSQPPHLPSFFHFLEALIPLENVARVESDLRKLAGATVGDVMTPAVITVGPDEPVSEVAMRMVTRHLSMIPVVDGERLLGAVTKVGILRSAYGLAD